MVQYEVGKIKLGGLFSKSIKILFEIKFERSSMEGEVSIITMKSEEGKEIGKLEYAVKDNRSLINTFIVRDWSNINYAKALLKKYLEIAKKNKVKHVEGEIYDKDATTYDKLQLLKKLGFKVTSGGKLTGYQQYYITKKV